ncbi:MAG TPA: hypothetical protein IAB49_06700 [Candidatus Caccenecus avistercoris]|nr:hypothetical protein [Candidatus Caccenecus avistercoris]
MKTRMEKYYDEENNNIALRERKNKNLYENINDYEVEDYEIKTNATVLDNNAKNIDVEKIKKILDTKYNKQPKRRSIVVDDADYQEPDISLDETREYDINAILEKARSEKEVDYEKERLKKIRDTQYDILNSLDIEGEEKEEKQEENNELMDLINTITAKELEVKNKKEDLDPLDILTDLKGSDNTVVVDGIHEESESVNETSPIMSLEEADKIKPTIMENKTQDLTSTLQFTQSDFDDFNDLKKEVKSSRALIYIIIVVVCLILVAGVIIFLNKFLNLSLF